MDSETNLVDLCKSLDKVTLDFFDTLEMLYQSQAKLELLMRGGFLSLSRARYSMGGTRNVGALQFAKNELEMEPLSVVNVSSEQDVCDDENNKTLWPSCEMELVEKHNDVSNNSTAEILDTGKDTPKKAEELRQRKGAAVVSEEKTSDRIETVGSLDPGIRKEKTETVEETAKSSKSEDPRRLKDPLTLFGVLVSPHLRRSQSSFKQAVAATVEIANLKRKLQRQQQQFAQLKAQKKALVA